MHLSNQDSFLAPNVRGSTSCNLFVIFDCYSTAIDFAIPYLLWHSPPTQHSLTADSAISLLLRRGADPNSSPLPLPPLVYAIRSGDVLAVEQLLERGADVNQYLPPEVKSVHSLSCMVDCTEVDTVSFPGFAFSRIDV